MLVLGFLLISAFKAGNSIAEFSTVGRMCGQSSAVGFAFCVLAKHALGVFMTWGVPLVLRSTDDDILGIARVQLVLLVPHGLSMLAGIALARMCPSDSAELDGEPEVNGEHLANGALGIPRAPTTPPANGRSKFMASPAVGSALSRIGSLLGLSSADAADESKGEAAAAAAAVFRVTMIGLWRALAVGTLHAYHSIRIKFMQSHGLQLTGARSAPPLLLLLSSSSSPPLRLCASAPLLLSSSPSLNRLLPTRWLQRPVRSSLLTTALALPSCR